MNKWGYYFNAVAIVAIEVVIHQIFAVKYIGWGAGFQYYILCVLILPFLVEGKHILAKSFISILCIVTFLYLQCTYQDMTPVYSLGEGTLQIFNLLNITSAMLLIIFWGHYFNKSVNEAEAELEFERHKSDEILFNTLPKSIALRLKKNKETIADKFENVTVLFLDVVGYTAISSTKSPSQMVEVLNELFSGFDDLASKYKLEKIKTIGDCYMIAAGVPVQAEDDISRMADFSLEIIPLLNQFNQKNNLELKVRIGFNTGDVVAGVIGKYKFIYDLWGDAVNIASRMESHGLNGEIQVSQSSFDLLKDSYILEPRGDIEIKGKGIMHTYILKAKK